MIEEIQNTNNVEGIRSSKKDLNLALNSAFRHSSNQIRFQGLVTHYLRIGQNQAGFISDIKDFRRLWDELVGGEEVDNRPDAQLFRKEAEAIYDGDRQIHAGDNNETEILNDLESLLAFMNSNDFATLPKVIISHYFYEYIHPFYDGNGRTGRYIICAYLVHYLDALTAINFSSAIADDKNRYYKSFTEMGNPINHGDATLFIIRIMEIILTGQEKALEQLSTGINRLKHADQMLDDLLPLPVGYSDRQRNIVVGMRGIVRYLYQQAVFGYSLNASTDQDLAKVLGTTRYRLDQQMSHLEAQGIIKLMQEMPKIHQLTNDAYLKLD